MAAGRPLSRFVELFHDHAASSLDKQLALGDMLGDHEWHVDMDSGRITFTTGRLLSKKRQTYAVQVLGTESEVSNTWLWGWANQQTPVPAPLLHAANRLKAVGAKEGVPEFTQPQVALDAVSGHHFAMIASGLLGAHCYYRGPYESGAVFLLIRDPSFPKPAVEPLARIPTIFPQLVSSMEIADHRRCFLAYLGYYKLNITEEGSTVTARAPSGRLTAHFDAERRLVGLNVEAN